MTDSDAGRQGRVSQKGYRWATSPAGEKFHIIVTSESLLALGKPEKSDYRSICGVVPDEWNVRLCGPTSRVEVCDKCAANYSGDLDVE